MGSPQYGELLLDGVPLSRRIEARSLLWSDDGTRLAAQELVEWYDGPTTCVVVFDTRTRARVAESPARDGLDTPLRFEPGSLVYRHWHHRAGEREMKLPLPD